MRSNANSTPPDEGRRIHLIIDVLNDFISGSLACNHAQEAIVEIVNRINTHREEEVIYICDTHPANHCSFIEQGGSWPPHCVRQSFGREIDLSFYTRVEQPAQRPRISENIFEKGTHPNQEE